jgi:hypothetical protein
MNRMKSTGLMGIFLSSLLLCGYSEMTGKVREGGERAFGPAGGVEALRDYVAFVSDVERRKGASSPILGTAGEWYQMAMDSALSWSSDVLPVVIFNTDTLDTEGTSRGWGYSFFSSLMDSVLYVQVSDAVVQFSQSQPPLFTDPISGSWIDSDDIIPVTEVSGGSVYRDSNTGVLLQAFLAGQLYDPCVSNSYFWTIGYTSESSSELDFFMKGTNPVLYGYEFLCEGTEVTAASAVQAARQKSLLWAGDAGLFRIESVGTLDELGRSSGWLFEYLSMSKGRKRLYRTCDDSTYTDRTTGVIGGWIPKLPWKQRRKTAGPISEVNTH